MRNIASRNRCRGFTIIEMMLVIFVFLVLTGAVAIYAKRAYSESAVAAFTVNEIQFEQNVRAAYQGSLDYAGFTYAVALQQGLVPTSMLNDATTGLMPYGTWHSEATSFPGTGSGSDTVRIVMTVNDLATCIAITDALAPRSVSMTELYSATTIAAVNTAASPRNNGAIPATAQTACTAAFTARHLAVLTYYFL